METEMTGMQALHAALANGLGSIFVTVVDLISHTRGRVIVTGMGKSGHIGTKIAATLASTGTPAFFVHPAEASHGDLGMITNEDVVLAMSWSGETAELAAIVGYTKRFRVPLIAFTSRADSTLGRAADYLLTLPVTGEACPHGLAPTTSTTLQLALGDCLAIALLEARGFTAQDFRVYHPGGKLGASLRLVRDLMYTGARLPLAPLGTKMSDAILTMTGKGFGCLGITDTEGRLVGVITDGDLRRNIAGDLLQRTVDQVMNPRPHTIAQGVLAASALETLNKSAITSLFVVEEGRPIGIIHMHDLLRAGAA
ncbi:KpsF/GutQ family sugar-phosphate isomerase [Pseudoxanthobacter sp.]|uniref:KpsF/GutQ family sugar-phosphate isomerase n=1 Tax=Pseudoxanthobacter sp. TaxID=1925742 RepID=UPI002FE3AF2B